MGRQKSSAAREERDEEEPSGDYDGQNSNSHNSQGVFVTLVADTTVSTAWAQLDFIKKQKRRKKEGAKKMHINQLKALCQARSLLEPFLEVSKLWTDMTRFDLTADSKKAEKNSILSINLHPLQGEVDQELWLEHLKRAFLDYVTLNGVSIQSVHNDTEQELSLLQFVPGLGPRKALRLMTKIRKSNRKIQSRLQLKLLLLQNSVNPVNLPSASVGQEKENQGLPVGMGTLDDVILKLESQVDLNVLYSKTSAPSHVYENCIGFVRVQPFDGTGSLDEERSVYEEGAEFNWLDASRVHPANYKLTCLLCWMALYKDKPMPKFVQAKLSMADKYREEEDLDEQDVVARESTATTIDRDDIVVPEQVLSAIRKIMKSSEREIRKIIEGENNLFVDSLINDGYIDFFGESMLLVGLQDIKTSLAQGDEDNVSSLLQKRQRELEDLVGAVDLLEINNLLNNEYFFEDKLVDLIFSVQEVRFPFLEKKKLFELDSPDERYKKVITDDLVNLKIGSQLTAKVIEFSHRSIVLRLSNGFRAFVGLNDITEEGHNAIVRSNINLSKEEQVENYCNRELGMKQNDIISVWVNSIEPEFFRITCTLIEKDVLQLLETGVSRIKDPYWTTDTIRDVRDRHENDHVVKPTETSSKRRITHPDFLNLSQKEFNKKAVNMGVGDYFFKPSSKGLRYLSLYWKVIGNKFNNQVVEESDKDPNDPELGKCLKINQRKFEDLDDIVANYISPMNSFFAELAGFTKHFREATFNEAKKLCNDEKERSPKLVPYFIIPDRENPTLFNFVFQPANTVHKLSFAVKPEGFKIDSRSTCNSLPKLVEHFKKFIMEKLKDSRRSNGGSSYRSKRNQSYGQQSGYSYSGSSRNYQPMHSSYQQGYLNSQYNSSSYRR